MSRLDEIRERVRSHYYHGFGSTYSDLSYLLAEVERLRTFVERTTHDKEWRQEARALLKGESDE